MISNKPDLEGKSTKCGHEGIFTHADRSWYDCPICDKRSQSRMIMPVEDKVLGKPEIKKSYNDVDYMGEEEEYYEDEEEDITEHLQPRRKPRPAPVRKLSFESELLQHHLTRAGCKKDFIEFMVDESEREGFISPERLEQSLQQYESGVKNIKKSRLIIDGYERSLDDVIDDEEYPSHRQSRFRDSRRQPESEPLTMTDYLQLQQAQAADLAIKQQLTDKDREIQRLTEEVYRIQNRYDKLEAESKGEIKSLEKEIKEQYQQLMDARVDAKTAKIGKFDPDQASFQVIEKVVDKFTNAKPLQTMAKMVNPPPMPPNPLRDAPPPIMKSSSPTVSKEQYTQILASSPTVRPVYPNPTIKSEQPKKSSNPMFDVPASGGEPKEEDDENDGSVYDQIPDEYKEA